MLYPTITVRDEDITGNEEWHMRYRFEIPVVFVNGVKRLSGRITREELEREICTALKA